MGWNILIFVLTICILAYVGAVARVWLEAGNYLLFSLIPLAAVVGCYVYGEEEDREYFRRAWRWITRTRGPQ
jgi:hypothetical protein